MHKGIKENDNIILNVLKYKQIGSEIKKLEFHLDMAHKSFDSLRKICKQTEEETGVNMSFISE
jgi:hypothetical protein